MLEMVITAREADRATVETDRGPVTVLVRPHTRILVGESGLTLESLRATSSPTMILSSPTSTRPT